MTAYELDPAWCHLGGDRVVVHWPGLHRGQHITVEIGDRRHAATRRSRPTPLRHRPPRLRAGRCSVTTVAALCTQALRVLGNGVVPQQAAHALRFLGAA